MLLNSAKLIGAGLATISISGTGVGIGIIFAALINAYSRTPEHQKQLFTYAILGFALSEAIALFGLMLSFLILFSVRKSFKRLIVLIMYQLVLVAQFPIYETFKECFDLWAGLFWVKLCKLLNSFVHYFNVADACMRLVQRFVASSLLFLKYDSYLQFLICIDLIAYDQPGKKYRFTVIYYLMSLIFNTRLHLVTQVETFQGIETVCTIFSSANWSERELWDMFGIFIENHPDLRRILTDYGFSGFPLRKDFPVSGHKELLYSDFIKNIEYRGISLMQEMRTTLYDAKWIRDPSTSPRKMREKLELLMNKINDFDWDWLSNLFFTCISVYVLFRIVVRFARWLVKIENEENPDLPWVTPPTPESKKLESQKNDEKNLHSEQENKKITSKQDLKN